jgi:hypothetical protein
MACHAPVRILKILTTVMKIRKAEMIPLVSLLGHPLQSSVAPDKKLETQ